MTALLAGLLLCMVWVGVGLSVVLVHACQLVCLARELLVWWRQER